MFCNKYFLNKCEQSVKVLKFFSKLIKEPLNNTNIVLKTILYS